MPPATPGSSSTDSFSVKVTNPLTVARPRESIALSAADLAKLVPGFDLKKALVVDDQGALLVSQVMDLDGNGEPDELVFQLDLAASESKSVRVRVGPRALFPKAEYKVYARFVRERFDDFVWENDKIANRIYGPALETADKEPLISSGIDVWVKRVPELVVNEWYMTDAYHEDHGQGADFYSVGTTRGCGGLGIYSGGKLAVSRNFEKTRVLAAGPIRLVFELEYAPWIVDGVPVSEKRRVTLDAGSRFNRFESTFTQPGRKLSVGLGIAKHAGAQRLFDTSSSSLQSFEPLNGGKDGNVGCALVVSASTRPAEQQTETDHLLVLPLPANNTVVYYAGSAWDRASQISDVASWTKETRELSARLENPVKVELGILPSAATWSKRAAELGLATPAPKDIAGVPLVLADSLVRLSARTKDPRYLEAVKKSVDALIAGGTLAGYSADAQDAHAFGVGRLLLALQANAAPADKERYAKALEPLRSQLKAQPKTKSGAYAHSKAAASQLWLEDSYALGPFLAELATANNDAAGYADAVRYLATLERHLRNAKTGLFSQGFDEKHQEKWANAKSGASAAPWGVTTGLYAAAVVDTLERLPAKHPGRGDLRNILVRLAKAVSSVQDAQSGVFWQVLDAPKRGKNYLESSSSSLLVYALAKGVHNKWLPAKEFEPIVARAYRGILDEFVSVDEKGAFKLDKVSRVASLSGNPSDGTLDSYAAFEPSANDPNGVGAFIAASLELESPAPVAPPTPPAKLEAPAGKQPIVAKPETPKPEAAKPPVVPKPEVPKPEAPKPSMATKPEAPKAEPAKPEAPKPPAAKPEPAKPAPAPATSAAPAPKPPSSAAPAAK
jgi:rhamnogalacturonyl hydrolase YesR